MLRPHRFTMALKARATRSEFSSRVTVYEPVAQPPAVAALSTPLKRSRVTRSTSAATPSPVKPKYEEEDSDQADEDQQAGDDYDEQQDAEVKPKRARSSKPKVFVNSLDKPHPEPRKWKEQLVVLENQRKSVRQHRGQCTSRQCLKSFADRGSRRHDGL